MDELHRHTTEQVRQLADVARAADERRARQAIIGAQPKQQAQRARMADEPGTRSSTAVGVLHRHDRRRRRPLLRLSAVDAISALRELIGPAAEGLTDDEVLRGVEALSRAAVGAGMTGAELLAGIHAGTREFGDYARRCGLHAVDGGERP